MPLTADVAASAGAARPALFDLAPFDRRLDADAVAPLAVAYSGGGDSLALLLSAAAWAARAGRPLLALHVDHGLQPQSPAWADAAESTVRGLGAEFRLLRWEGEKPTTGLSAAARSARLRLLADAVRATGARVLLLGHTADDVLEAEAMRAEGSTLGRLREWSPSPVWPEGRGVFHFRPLLHVHRAEIRDRLMASGHAWIDDPANEDLRFARARARKALESAAAEPPREDPADPAVGALADAARVGPDGSVAVARAVLAAAEDVAARIFLRLALLCAAGTERPPRSDQIDRLLVGVRGAGPVAAALAGARVIGDDENVLFVRNAGERARGGLAPMALRPGVATVWDGRFELSTDAVGWEVKALTGLTSRLPDSERRRLKSVPAPARPALPVMVNAASTMTCPILAKGPVRARPLARRRLLAAAGWVATESQAAALAHGEEAVPVLFWRGENERACE